MAYRRFDYESVPYRGTVVPNTSPNHLAICASWCQGPRPPSRCLHVAELGCGDGANLLPLAFYHPESTFTGIDNSRTALDRAHEGAHCLDLDNIRFVLKDVRDLDPAVFAPCDYVIAHGLYSWVGEDARDAILTFCCKSLMPSGLAYISYNAQPGWATRSLVRETLLRARLVREAAVEAKAERAIEVATQLLEDLPSRDYAFAVLLAEELKRVRNGKPFYVFHEYLAEVNEGFWLRDFVERARRNGLDYVADAQSCRWEGHVPGDLKSALAKRDLDPIEQEEAADLLCNRYFRASILCRADAPRSSTLHRELLEELHIATCLRAESDPFDLREGEGERFFRPGGPEITLDASITKAAVVLMAAQWPLGMRLQTLYQQATQLLTVHGCEVPTGARSQLSDELMTLFEAGQIDLRLREPAHHTEVPDYPQAHALALFEAEHREALTTPYHVLLPFEPQALALVRTLDGSRSRVELQRAFGKELVDQTLEILGRWGLLVW
jgi:methyltransferase-like protein/ubiquinone/menaquinone biosynthesis C-methylase UbiE